MNRTSRKKFSLFVVMILLSLYFFSSLPNMLNFTANALTTEGFTIHHKSYIDTYVNPENQTFKTLLIMGEVINNKSYPVSDLNLTITFYNASRVPIKKLELKAPINVIFPGRRSPFKVGVNLDELKGYMYYNIKVSSYKISYAGKPFGLKISHASVTLYPNKTVVKGYIENIGDKEINNFLIFACLYDEKGFVGVTDAYLFYVPENSKDVLYPNSVTEFTAFTRFINSSFNIVKCIVTGESREYALVDEKIITSNANESLKITFWLTVGILIAFSTVVLVIIYTRRRKKRSSKATLRKSLRRTSFIHNFTIILMVLRQCIIYILKLPVLSTDWRDIKLKSYENTIFLQNSLE